jgi:hypothetical protein
MTIYYCFPLSITAYSIVNAIGDVFSISNYSQDSREERSGVTVRVGTSTTSRATKIVLIASVASARAFRMTKTLIH